MRLIYTTRSIDVPAGGTNTTTMTYTMAANVVLTFPLFLYINRS